MAKLSRNVPPLDAVATIVPAAGGPCRTVSHSCSVKSLLPVIARSSASGGLANLDPSFVGVANITAHFGGARLGGVRESGPRRAPVGVNPRLDAGADAAATLHAYGGTPDTLTMLRSSAHPRAAGVAADIE